MGFKMFKNTVLFQISIAIILVILGCKNARKDTVEFTELTIQNSELENKQQDISVGANQVGEYLSILKDKNIAIVANQTSMMAVLQRRAVNNSTMGSQKVTQHLVDYLHNYGTINVKKIFSPEHGFRGKADAGELVKDGRDSKTGLPIVSLHGKNKKPSPEQLKGIDMVVFDIQDVGVRFYTYISTLHHVMEACAESNIPLLVLDRPNPNGSYVDGPVLEKKHSSFLGMHPIPLVHGMTIGEYAQMINGENWLKDGIKCDLDIIKVKNYTHNTPYNLPIRPSPNLPNTQSILLYPSLGLFEGTNINAGRGTEFQFQRYGAPFLDKDYYTFSYTPVANFGAKYPKHQNTVCYGKDLSTINVDRRFTLKYIIDAYNNTTDKTKFFITSGFTTHAGTEQLQKQIESGLSENEIRESWEPKLEAYKTMRQKYLIYN